MDHDARIINSTQRQDSRCFVRDKMQEAIEAGGFVGGQLLVLYFYSRRMRRDPAAIISVPVEELSQKTGLSASSITRAHRALVKAGALVLRRKAAPGMAAAHGFGPALLALFRAELEACQQRKEAQPTSATVADVALNARQMRPAHPPRWRPTSTDLREKNNNGGGNEGKELRIKGQPLSEAPEGLLRFIAFEATKARPMLKVAAKAELERRERAEERRGGVPGVEATARYLAERGMRRTA